MTTHFVGTTFQANSQWHKDEKNLVESIRGQINKHFPNGQNLFVNTTWFGPQFNNGLFNNLVKLLETKKFDRLFLLASVDPICLNSDQIQALFAHSGATELFLLGNFDNCYQFTFIASLLPLYFHTYSDLELLMQDPKWLYLNYNRKPRTHRVELVNSLRQHNLENLGIITLGNDSSVFNNSSITVQPFNLNETPNEGNWGMSMEYGIPHDIHSLGNLDIWQNHFLTIASETEFLPWDPMFITEKTWKPILGLRPFVINGQLKIYNYLRSQGFRTFNHYWPHIPTEDIPEYEVHNSIVSVIKYIAALSSDEIKKLYQDMLPDLTHNRNRFFEFAKEQQHKTQNLFT